ncbi:MAG: phosphoribosylformylglycinamidine synthase, partial [Planctomycetia bacterium]
MLWEVDVHLRDAAGDHAARALVAGAIELGITGCTRAKTAAGWLIEGELSRADVERLAATVLADPVTETFTVADLGGVAESTANAPAADGLPTLLHVLPRAGVTDPAAETMQEACGLLGLRPTAVRSVRKYWLPSLDRAAADRLAWKLLASEAIHDVVFGPLTLRTLSGGRPWTFSQQTVRLAGLDDAALEKLSRDRCLALSAAELHAVRDHFQGLGRDPLEIELETIAQTWSEHCCHK